jgi:hypothetical protein
MYNAPYRGVANDLAKYGRYGDSMLVHMNPVEVQGLASLSPTGKLTTNPVTGQPEAFLPFLAPLLGSFLGSTVLTGAGAGALGGLIGAGGLSSAAAGALGSAAATTLATGDLEQGILSGLTGYGLGSALGAAGEASKAATDVATGAQAAAPGIAAEGIAPDLLASPTAVADAASTSAVNPAFAREFGGTVGGTQLMGGAPSVGSFGAAGVAPAIEAAAPQLASVTAQPPGFMDRLTQPFQEPGAFFSELAKPQNILPIYMGEGMGAQIRAEEAAQEGFRKQQEEMDSERRAALMRTQGQIADVFGQIRRDYPGVGYAKGGMVEGYFDGGDIENQIYNAMRQSPYAGIPSAEETQLSLRGTEMVAPPAASYSALDVGGEGYLPGVSPEFMFFRTPTPPPPAAIDPGSMPGAGGIADFYDPNFDLGTFMGGFRGARDYSDIYGGAAGMPDSRMNFVSPTMSQDRLGEFDSALYERLMKEADVPVRDLNEGRMAIPELSLEEMRTLRNMRPIAFQEGGEVPEMGAMMEEMSLENEMNDDRSEYDELIRMTISAIRGEIENSDEVISQFLEEFGSDAFRQLREAVLQGVVPDAQTEGMVEGMGGGQDDMVEGMIGTQRPVAVSPGEYIIPADAVALAGGGYSGDGAKFFDGLVDDIRSKTMGTTEQVRPYQERAA